MTMKLPSHQSSQAPPASWGNDQAPASATPARQDMRALSNVLTASAAELTSVATSAHNPSPAAATISLSEQGPDATSPPSLTCQNQPSPSPSESRPSVSRASLHPSSSPSDCGVSSLGRRPGLERVEDRQPDHRGVPTSSQGTPRCSREHLPHLLMHQQDDRRTSTGGRFTSTFGVPGDPEVGAGYAGILQPMERGTAQLGQNVERSYPQYTSGNNTINKSFKEDYGRMPYRQGQTGFAQPHADFMTQEVVGHNQQVPLVNADVGAVDQEDKFDVNNRSAAATPTHIQSHGFQHGFSTQASGYLHRQIRPSHQAYEDRSGRPISITSQPAPLYISAHPEPQSTYQYAHASMLVGQVQRVEQADPRVGQYDGSVRHCHDTLGTGAQYEGLPQSAAPQSLPVPNGFRSLNSYRGAGNERRSEIYRADVPVGPPAATETKHIFRSYEARLTSSSHYGNSHGTLLSDAIESFLVLGGPFAADRPAFVDSYFQYLNTCEEELDSFCDSVDIVCLSLCMNSRVPFLNDTITAPVDDETAEDAHEKLTVKKKFVEAMERLQGDQLPTKRRGNLPKESTAYLKKWFQEHYDNPYPTDEEKLEMSKITKIGIQQISHWFINHRKRVWKPSLPEGHRHSGDSSTRARKKARKDGDR